MRNFLYSVVKPRERKALVTWWVFTCMNVGMTHRFFPRVRSRDCLLNVLVGSSLHICFCVILVCSPDGGHSKVHGDVCLQESLDSDTPRPGLALCTLGGCIQGVDWLGIKPVFTSTAVSQIWGL